MTSLTEVVPGCLSLSGPTEEDSHYIADTGASPASMVAQTAAFQESMYQLVQKVRSLGGFWWQLMDASGDGCLGVRRESLNVLQHGGRLRRTIHHMLLFHFVPSVVRTVLARIRR